MKISGFLGLNEEGGGGAEQRLTANRQGVSFRVNKHVLKPDCANDCTVL